MAAAEAPGTAEIGRQASRRDSQVVFGEATRCPSAFRWPLEPYKSVALSGDAARYSPRRQPQAVYVRSDFPICNIHASVSNRYKCQIVLGQELISRTIPPDTRRPMNRHLDNLPKRLCNQGVTLGVQNVAVVRSPRRPRVFPIDHRQTALVGIPTGRELIATGFRRAAEPIKRRTGVVSREMAAVHSHCNAYGNCCESACESPKRRLENGFLAFHGVCCTGEVDLRDELAGS